MFSVISLSFVNPKTDLIFWQLFSNIFVYFSYVSIVSVWTEGNLNCNFVGGWFCILVLLVFLIMIFYQLILMSVWTYLEYTSLGIFFQMFSSKFQLVLICSPIALFGIWKGTGDLELSFLPCVPSFHF